MLSDGITLKKVTEILGISYWQARRLMLLGSFGDVYKLNPTAPRRSPLLVSRAIVEAFKDRLGEPVLTFGTDDKTGS